ncbi:unnamed protein product [Effrenium voratum]|nr:unnamed protein product [Effrenium voratum]
MSSGNTYVEAREVTTQGPVGKLCGSLCCSCLGVFLYFGALALLAYNEQSTVCAAKALLELRDAYEEVDCSGESARKEGAIHISCPLVEDSLVSWTPQDFGDHLLQGAFEVQAAKMRQEVQMLQCVETKHSETRKQHDKTVKVESYTYALEWRGSWVDSSSFRAFSGPQEAKDALWRGCGNFRGNPRPQMPVGSRTLTAPQLRLGAFDVTRFLGDISTKTPVRLTQTGARRVAKDGKAYTWREFEDYYGSRAESEWNQARTQVQLRGNTAQTCEEEELGCLRISYFQSSATHGSHIGKLSGRANGLVKTRSWRASASWLCSNVPLDLFAEGVHTAEELIEAEEQTNTAKTWALRALGAVLAVLGVFMFLNPLQTLAELVNDFFQWFRSVPLLGSALLFLGDCVGAFVGCGLALVALAVGAPSALLVISLSWCVMRPLLGIPLAFLSAAALSWGVRSLLRAPKQKGN